MREETANEENGCEKQAGRHREQHDIAAAAVGTRLGEK
jgi:hypothetical protein